MCYNYDVVKKSFKFRIKAGKQTLQNAEKTLGLCCWLYNTALEQRISVYKGRKKTINYYNQANELHDLKEEFPEFKQVGSQVLQNVLKKLDLAYASFFRRIKHGETPGFPRFKGRDRFDSFMFPGQSGWKLQGHYLNVSKVGLFRVKMHRPIEGEIKTVTFKKSRTNKWYVVFSCDNVPEKLLPKTGKHIGIDVGCESFIVDNNNRVVENPRFFKNGNDKLAKRQQTLATKTKGSNNRSKARFLVAKAHEHVSSQRKDFHFKTALTLIKENDTIYVEDMRAWNTKSTGLNRSMRDVAWFQFFDILQFKAEEAGKQVIKVPAAGTSQCCSSCGCVVEKQLSERIHACPECGFETSRDHNAAINIFRAGEVRRNKSFHDTVPRSPGL